MTQHIKRTSVLLALLLIVAMIAGCAKQPDPPVSEPSGDNSTTAPTTTEPGTTASVTEPTQSTTATGADSPASTEFLEGTDMTTKPTGGRPAANYELKVSVEQQELDVLREDEDATRRLWYVKFNNPESKAYKSLMLTYAENGKIKTRMFSDIYVNNKYMLDTLWVNEELKTIDAVLTDTLGNTVWKGALTVTPAKESFTVRKSYVYPLTELETMSLRGINYYPRYQAWTALNTQKASMWDSEFAEISKLNANAIRIICDKDGTDMKIGNCVTPEFLRILDTIFATAAKHNLRVMPCLGGPSGNIVNDTRTMRSIVETFCNDGRVIGWDLTNEPDAHDLGVEGEKLWTTFCTRLYPLLSEWDPNHMNNIGYAYMLDRPGKAGLTHTGAQQCWQYHWYRKLDIATVNGLYDQYFNERPFIIGECGDTNYLTENNDPLRPGADVDHGEEWQKSVYESIITTANDAIKRRLPMIGIFPWTAFDFPKLFPQLPYEASLGVIKEDGSLKPAGEVLRDGYAQLKVSNPAPWER